MSILFVHPPFDQSPSGGNRFNANLIARAGRILYPLTSFSIAPDRIHCWDTSTLMAGEFDLILWDSLFIEALAEGNIKPTDSVSSLLVHYLPSQNPKLGCIERCNLQAKETQAIEKVRRIIATGERIQETLMDRFPDTSVALAEPGVDPLFRPNREVQPAAAGNSCVQLVTVANMLSAKGYLDLLNILAKTPAKNFHWHIVGDDCCDRAYADEFRLTVQRLNLSEFITYHGILSTRQLRDLMIGADLFISASYFEAYGMALAEAAAMGIPAVATRVGEADRLVRHGNTGYLVPVGQWDSMAEYIAELIDNYTLRARFGQNARKRKPRTWDQTFEDFRAACRPWCN